MVQNEKIVDNAKTNRYLLNHLDISIPSTIEIKIYFYFINNVGFIELRLGIGYTLIPRLVISLRQFHFSNQFC